MVPVPVRLTHQTDLLQLPMSVGDTVRYRTVRHELYTTPSVSVLVLVLVPVWLMLVLVLRSAQKVNDQSCSVAWSHKATAGCVR